MAAETENNVDNCSSRKYSEANITKNSDKLEIEMNYSKNSVFSNSV